MRLFLSVVFVLLSLPGFGQNKFNDAEKLSQWMMHYYEQPEPEYLFAAFEFANQSKEIGKSGSRGIMMSFIASAIRHDTVRIADFSRKLATTTDKDIVFGFLLVLWYVDTDYSFKKIKEFSEYKHLKRYHKDITSILNQQPLDLFNAEIVSPDHLDMLWCDFFATGNEASIERISTKLKDLKSEDAVQKVTAGSARWSLISNSVQHDRVYQICQKLAETTADPELKAQLETIVTLAGNERR